MKVSVCGPMCKFAYASLLVKADCSLYVCIYILIVPSVNKIFNREVE